MKQQGFTLIELIIVCAILAIASFGLTSSYTSLIDKVHENKDISRLLLMIRTTRLYSINHSSTSVLCPSTDQSNCIRNWKLPLILFIDENKNKKRDENETILNRFEPFSADNIRINYPKAQIRFNEQGMANYYNGTLSYCLNQSATGIVISRLGRIRFALDLDGDHIPDVNRNTPIICQ